MSTGSAARKQFVSINKRKFAKLKLSMSLDYIFGRATSTKLKLDEMGYEYSRKTGRLRYVVDPTDKRVLFSFRANGSIAPTVNGAKLLLSHKKLKRLSERPRFAVTVLNGVGDFVANGKTVFCKHVVSCHKSLRAGEDVVVLNEEGKLLAVGKSVLPCQLMKQFKRGVAVKVREGIKSQNGTVPFV
ncbi:MAG: pseudouridine synthase [archaeon]|nr:pseudouridine synthase [archaeon]